MRTLWRSIWEVTVLGIDTGAEVELQARPVRCLEKENQLGMLMGYKGVRKRS